MAQNPSRRNALRRIGTPAVAVAAALLLSGCVTVWQGGMFGPDTPGAPPSNQSTDSDGTDGSDAVDDNAAEDGASEATPGNHRAAFVFDDESFTFTPTLCVVDFGEEIRVSGPGVVDADKTPVFMDIDIDWDEGSGAGTLFIYEGTDTSAANDNYIKGAVGGGNDFSMGDMRDGFEIAASYFTHDQEEMGEGTFTLNCE